MRQLGTRSCCSSRPVAEKKTPNDRLVPSDWVDWFPDDVDRMVAEDPTLAYTDAERAEATKEIRADPKWQEHQRWVKSQQRKRGF